MPMMSKNPKKKPARSAREIEEILGTIEQYLVQTREVLDRIEEDITELKKGGKLEIEKDEAISSKKIAAKEMEKTL